MSTTSYIGLEPSYASFDKQLLTGDGSTVTFTLDFAVAQVGQILVSLDGIIQEPEYSYNISLSTGSPKISFADLHQVMVLEFQSYILEGQVCRWYLHLHHHT